MRTWLAIAGVAFLTSAWGGTQVLSLAEMSEAIEQGRAGKTLEKKCKASGENGFDIIVEGPVGRVMRAAREAKRRGEVFSAANVTPEMIDSFVTVRALRDPQLTTASLARERAAAPGAYTIPDNSASRFDRFRVEFTIRSTAAKATPVVLQPVRPIWYDRDWGPNYMSNVPQELRQSLRIVPAPGTDMLASFDLSAFGSLPAGDAEIRIFVSDAGDRKCSISEKERNALR